MPSEVVVGTDGSLYGYDKTVGMSSALRIHLNSSPSVRKVQNEQHKPSQFIIAICRAQLASRSVYKCLTNPNL